MLVPLRRLLFVALILSVVGACGSGSSDDVQVLGEQRQRAAIFGVVRRAGTPVAAAHVTLGSTSVVADASGAYRIDDVAPGSHRLEARDAGDDSASCAASGACVSSRSVAVVAVTVVVPADGHDVRADIDL